MWFENLLNIIKGFPNAHLLTVANPALAKPALFLRHPKKTHSWLVWFVFVTLTIYRDLRAERACVTTADKRRRASLLPPQLFRLLSSVAVAVCITEGQADTQAVTHWNILSHIVCITESFPCVRIYGSIRDSLWSSKLLNSLGNFLCVNNVCE